MNVPKLLKLQPCARLLRALCTLPSPHKGVKALCARRLCTRFSSTLCAPLCVPCVYLVRTLCVYTLCAALCAALCATSPCARLFSPLVRRATSRHKVVHKATILANGHIYIYIRMEKMLYKKIGPWISLMLCWFFLVLHWLSLVNLRNLQTLGKFYPFLIIWRSRNAFCSDNPRVILGSSLAFLTVSRIGALSIAMTCD